MKVTSTAWRSLPTEDRAMSPSTGWTRAHWEAVVDVTLAAVRPYASDHHALIDLPGPASKSGRWSDGLEGFARTFMAAGFRLAHDDGDTAGSVATWYAEGLAAGVDPRSPDRWPRLDEVHQARVEAASIVLALHESRSRVWDNLDDRIRQQVVEWLSGAVGSTYPSSNWLWFQSVVQAFLRDVGGPWSAADIDRNLEITESFYLGDGWYTDGLIDGRASSFDWYAGWAMHVYPLWYCRISGSSAPDDLAQRYRERLYRYLEDVQHLFSPSGAPMHQGRSLTYRFASLAPIWAGAVFDATPLPPGRTRRLASGVLRHFVERGSWNEAGIQTLGWHHEFSPLRQSYSGPASPYWSSKGFLGLVLPPEHEVWTCPEARLVVEDSDLQLSLSVPGWTVSATAQDGIVRLVNHAADHAGQALEAEDAAYCRIGYSTHTGPQTGTVTQLGRDSTVALIDDRGELSHRRPIHRITTNGRVGISRFRAHWHEPGETAEHVQAGGAADIRTGPWVTTASVMKGPFEVRVVRVDAASDVTPEAHGVTEAGPLWLHVSGHAVADHTFARIEVGDNSVSVVRPDGLCSAAEGLRGLTVSEAVRETGVNAFGTHSTTPVLRTGQPVRLGQLYAAMLTLSADPAVVAELTGRPPTAVVDIVSDSDDSSRSRVRVTWWDGTTDTLRLGSPA